MKKFPNNFNKKIFLVLTIFLCSIYSYAASIPHAVKKILVVVAMDTEAQPIIAALNLHKINSPFIDLPMQEYSGKYKNLTILLITNGEDPVNKVQNVGTQAATLSAYLGVYSFHPDLIISIGTAGGVAKNGAKLRDIFISKKIYFFDRRLNFKGYHEYALGGYPSVEILAPNNDLGLKPGVICSGDSFDENTTDYKMFLNLNCSAIDMEAAGVAWVSMLTKTPMVAIKGITNFVKGADIHAQYQKNITVVTAELTTKLKAVLNTL